MTSGALPATSVICTPPQSSPLICDALAKYSSVTPRRSVSVLPGARTAWGDERRITVYDYLIAWSSHDADHEQAIRLAILSRPDLSAVALTRRRR